MYDTIMVDICHYTFVQTHRMFETTTVNPEVNYGLWVIMMYPCRFIDYKKYTTLAQDVDSG